MAVALCLVAPAGAARAQSPPPSDEERFQQILAPEDHYYRAEEFLAREQYDQADVELQIALHLDDLNPRFHHVLGRLRLVQRRYDEAIESMSRAIALDPRNTSYIYDLALCYQSRNEPERALATLQAALELNPHDARLHFQIGSLLHAQKKTDEAIRAFVQSITDFPMYAEAYRAIGEIYEAKQKWDKAILFYDQAGRLNPLDLDLHFRLASLHLTRRRDPGKARKIFEYILSGDPNDVETVKLLVQVYYGVEEDSLAAETRRLVWNLLQKRRSPEQFADQSYPVDTRMVGTELLTVTAPLQFEKEGATGYGYALAAPEAPPRRAFDLTRDAGRWRLIERLPGAAPRLIQAYGEQAPEYRVALDAVLAEVKKDLPKEGGSEASSDAGAADERSGRR